MPLDNTMIKDDILKRNIDQTKSTVDESVLCSSKRNCVVDDEKFHRKNSMITQRRKLISIVFHFASEESIDIHKSALSTINSSQLETDDNGNKIMDKNRPKTRSCQSEIILSHQIDATIENNSSLSISNTLLDRSLSDYKLTTLHISSHNSIGSNYNNRLNMLTRSVLVIVVLALAIFAIGSEAWTIDQETAWRNALIRSYYPVSTPPPGRWMLRWRNGKLWGEDRYLRAKSPVCFWYKGKCY
ncbi:unnamed protein product [Rotaria magnacalcarata]|uniref:Uncharacterized protein n=1 Tax=Rotaria magnacalcarata TaxID=392030 RepID=A0A8S3BYI3_9BILA|nr:unnamed protein product [Rotaria magnacalcarata]CAF4871732.1 unnamed protein product [Rotaria magnacalcarata]